MTATAVRGPGPVLVPGGGTAGLVPVPAEEKMCTFLKKVDWETDWTFTTSATN
jgi:hypothetical protein